MMSRSRILRMRSKISKRRMSRSKMRRKREREEFSDCDVEQNDHKRVRQTDLKFKNPVYFRPA